VKAQHLLGVALVLAGALAVPAHAGAPVCTLNVAGMSFGTYNPTSTAALGTMTSGTLLCTYTGTGFTATITVSTGNSGSYATRHMVQGAQALNYNVYLDPGHTVIFGNGSAGTDDFTVCYPGGSVVCTGTTVQSGVTYTGTVYGLIPAGQNIRAGAYADSLVVTVTY
jgi:spore coat protein U-like protein